MSNYRRPSRKGQRVLKKKDQVPTSTSPRLEVAFSHLKASNSLVYFSISDLCFSSLSLAASNAPLSEAS